jgi:hypothetical protein
MLRLFDFYRNDDTIIVLKYRKEIIYASPYLHPEPKSSASKKAISPEAALSKSDAQSEGI